MVERNREAERLDKITNLTRDLEMRKKMLEMMKSGTKGMPPEDIERDIKNIEDQLRELGVEPEE